MRTLKRAIALIMMLLLMQTVATASAEGGFEWLSVVDMLDPIKMYGLKLSQIEEVGSYNAREYTNQDNTLAVHILRDNGTIFAVYAMTKDQNTAMFLQTVANTVIDPENRLMQMMLNAWMQDKLFLSSPGDYSIGMLEGCYFEMEHCQDGSQWLRLTAADYYGTTWVD